MNQALRQRILGLLVLVALASVVLPLALDFGGDARIDTQSRILPTPEIQPTPLPDSAAAALQASEPSAPAAFDPSADTQPQLFQLAPTDAAPGPSAKSIPEDPRLNADGLPASWVLQAGAFQDKLNAEELSGRLLKGGHRAFVQTSTAGGKTTHRVFVGPKMTREQLVAEQAALQRKFGVETMVVPFAP
jgi:cell division septation protein DedD